MEALALLCTTGLVIAGLYWFLCVLGAAEQKGKRAMDLGRCSISREKVEDKYRQYWAFFRKPKEIDGAEKVPHFIDTFYNLVTDIYEWGWGQSFHFSPSLKSKSHKEATRLHEVRAVDLLAVRPSDRILDVGCGIGGPMCAITAHSGGRIVGITIHLMWGGSWLPVSWVAGKVICRCRWTNSHQHFRKNFSTSKGESENQPKFW